MNENQCPASKLESLSIKSAADRTSNDRTEETAQQQQQQKVRIFWFRFAYSSENKIGISKQAKKERSEMRAKNL